MASFAVTFKAPPGAHESNDFAPIIGKICPLDMQEGKIRKDGSLGFFSALQGIQGKKGEYSFKA